MCVGPTVAHCDLPRERSPRALTTRWAGVSGVLATFVGPFAAVFAAGAVCRASARGLRVNRAGVSMCGSLSCPLFDCPQQVSRKPLLSCHTSSSLPQQNNQEAHTSPPTNLQYTSPLSSKPHVVTKRPQTNDKPSSSHKPRLTPNPPASLSMSGIGVELRPKWRRGSS